MSLSISECITQGTTELVAQSPFLCQFLRKVDGEPLSQRDTGVCLTCVHLPKLSTCIVECIHIGGSRSVSKPASKLPLTKTHQGNGKCCCEHWGCPTDEILRISSAQTGQHLRHS